MKNYLIFILALLIVISCQKDVNEEIFEIEIDTRSANLNSEAISNSITIRWFPSNLSVYISSQFVWGSFRYRVTNNCPEGKSKIFTFPTLINGSEHEI